MQRAIVATLALAAAIFTSTMAHGQDEDAEGLSETPSVNVLWLLFRSLREGSDGDDGDSEDGDDGTATPCDLTFANPPRDIRHMLDCALTLAVNDQESSSISPTGDVDYFRVNVLEPGRLTVYTTGGTDTRGTLYDSRGREIIGNNHSGGGGNFHLERKVTARTYYITVVGNNGATGDYTIHTKFEPN